MGRVGSVLEGAFASNLAGTTPLHDIPAVARRLGVCRKTVRRLIERGELIAHAVGRQYRVSEDDLLEFLKRRRGLRVGVE